MNKRALGVVFIILSVFLFAIQLVCATILTFNFTTLSEKIFMNNFFYIGRIPLIISIFLFIIGFIFILRQEIKPD